MFLSRFLLLVTVVLLLGVFSVPADAQSCSKCACSVSSPALQFGSYSWNTSTVDIAGTIKVDCWRTPGGAFAGGEYTLQISAGTSGNTADRTMAAAGSSSLRYNVYTSAAMSTVWTTTGPYSFTLPTNGATFSRTHDIYGRLPGFQNGPAGPYADSLTVTLTYSGG